MILRLTTVHENARSALECGSAAERSCRLPQGKNKAVAGATALQGAFGTTVFMPAKNLALDFSADRQQGGRPRGVYPECASAYGPHQEIKIIRVARRRSIFGGARRSISAVRSG